MRASLILLLLLCGCANKAEVTAPDRLEPSAVGMATGHTAAVKFSGFDDFADYEVMGASHSGEPFYASADSFSDENVRLSLHQTSWNPRPLMDPPCTDAYSYNYGPLVVFPDGHEYDFFQLRVDDGVLCADMFGCPASAPYFFDTKYVVFAGVRREIPINPLTGRYVINSTFQARHKGYRAQLTVGEYLPGHYGGYEANGLHLTLWKGNRYGAMYQVADVKVSHVRMTQP